jgi:hypothetical protein
VKSIGKTVYTYCGKRKPYCLSVLTFFNNKGKGIMEEMKKAIYSNPQWVQPKINQRYFELRTNSQKFAELHFQSAFGSLANGVTAQNIWTLKRVGFFNPRVTVRMEENETDFAVYRPRWTGTDGVIEFANGRTYRWKTANFWATQYAVIDSTEKVLIKFHQGVDDSKFADIFKTQSRVEFAPESGENPDLALLTVSGFYLIILQQEDSSATTAATTAAMG